MSVLEIAKVYNAFFYIYILKAFDMLVSNIAPNAIVETTMANMEPYKYVTAKWIVVVQSMKIVAEVMQMVSTTLNMNVRTY